MRKKKETVEEFVYCHSTLVKCNRVDCARHSSNIPYNVMVLRSKEWKPNGDGNCKGYTECV